MSSSDPTTEDVAVPALLGPWQLMWRKFRRHRVAYWSLWIIGLIYFMALFGDFMSPEDPADTNRRGIFSPPQGIHFFVTGAAYSRRHRASIFS